MWSFVNGLPVRAELKKILTGSTFRYAEKQYRYDRSPAGEPLLTFKRGALVHFAMDEDNASMTTRLQNGKTRRASLKPISEFGAKPYTEDEERSLSEIMRAVNERLFSWTGQLKDS